MSKLLKFMGLETLINTIIIFCMIREDQQLLLTFFKNSLDFSTRIRHIFSVLETGQFSNLYLVNFLVFSYKK